MCEQITLLGPPQAAADRSSLSALPKDLQEQVRGRVRLLALLLAAGFAVDPLLVLVVWTLATLTRHPIVFSNPGFAVADGTVALSGLAISRDGKTMAYGLSSAGSDWQEWRFRNIETGADLPDTLKFIKFSGASWTKDGAGVFYSRYPEPDEKSKLSASAAPCRSARLCCSNIASAP